MKKAWIHFEPRVSSYFEFSSFFTALLVQYVSRCCKFRYLRRENNVWVNACLNIKTVVCQTKLSMYTEAVVDMVPLK